MSGTADELTRLLRESTLPVVATIVSVGVLVWVVYRLSAWFRDDSGPAEGSHELLLQFRDLQRRGDLTPDEYRSIQGRLVGGNADSPTVRTDSNDGQETESAHSELSAIAGPVVSPVEPESGKNEGESTDRLD